MNNMNMNAMGGPVGAPMPMMGNGTLAPQGGGNRPLNMNMDDASRTLLNTYIYEYFVRYGMFDCARTLLQGDPTIKKKDSPGSRRDEGGNLGNGLGDDPMDTDSKDGLDRKRPDDLPAPDVPTPLPDSCFLYEWFCLFWDMFNSQKGKGPSGHVNQYVQHTQQQSRLRQEQQQNMLRQIRPESYAQQQQQYNQQLMRGMQNGTMNMNMKPGNQLQRAAMANNQTPQTMHMLQQQKAAGQMQRDPSDMDGSRARPASPGTADSAPSPSKRPRLEGGPFTNPGQGVIMPNGRPVQGMPGQQQVGNGPSSAQALLFQHGVNPNSLSPDQLQAFVTANPNVQAKTIATYAANLQQHHGAQMPNKPMPNAGGPQGQGSPMVPQGPDGPALNQYYNAGDMAPGNMRPGPGNGQAAGGSNHALQDYQMQLMLLEQQNKKRLMMARQEQDMTGGMRPEGPGGPAGPGGPGGPGAPPGGPNAQTFQGTSPPGGRTGASPNPPEQLKRSNQQMQNGANMGSPLPDGGAQSRSSPNAINFMGTNLDPNGAPHFFKGVSVDMNMAGQMNGGMRPPSSHPGQPFNGQMNQQQMMAAQRQVQQQAGQGGPGIQWQNGPNGGQMPGQGPQPQVQGTPQQRAMPPPSAPAAAAAANNASSRNATSSPQVTNAQPPTPQQANKAGPKKKETKSSKSKAAATKKSNSNLNAGATPVAEPEAPQEAPTPATPITPGNPTGFKGQNAGGAQVPNGQPAAPAPPPAAPVAAPPQADPAQGAPFMENDLDFGMGFANPLTSNDVLDGFDFDSFLHDSNGPEDNQFDFNSNFAMEGGELAAE
ncbi:transcriptional regulator of filamentous growth FLO8 [Diplogelasinospora grovesii]|uniref:Transcriptional regulator of filamentous growth FLO8 n=1 Tax=Diplogelasinospora grovesii TaxID=303347 RepID=A0AAN6S7R6_9PEZI|nr:transcriptional regulator of filamentous growth FLO8 [Diplogelasinospora grovesii]